MKKSLGVFIMFFVLINCKGQQRVIDSLKRNLHTGNDTMDLAISMLLCEEYDEIDKDSAIHYANRYATISQKLNYDLNYADGLQRMVIAGSNSAKELGILIKTEQILEVKTSGKIPPPFYLNIMQVPSSLQNFQMYSQLIKGRVMNRFAFMYWSARKFNQAYPYAIQSLQIAEVLEDPKLLVWANLGLGILVQDSDSSLMYLKTSAESALRTGYIKDLGLIYDFTAKEYADRKEYDQQLFYLRVSLQHYLSREMILSSGWGYLGLGEFYLRSVPNRDSAFFYIRKAFQVAVDANYAPIRYWSSKDLYDVYKASGNKDSTFRYVEIMLEAREKVYFRKNENMA